MDMITTGAYTCQHRIGFYFLRIIKWWRDDTNMEGIQKVKSDLKSIENVVTSVNITDPAKLKRIRELVQSMTLKLELLNDKERVEEVKEA